MNLQVYVRQFLYFLCDSILRTQIPKKVGEMVFSSLIDELCLDSH